MNKAAACLDYSFGDGWVYDKAIRAFINNNSEINYFTASLLSTEQNASYYSITSNTAYVTEVAVKLLAERNAEREAAAAEEAANQEAARLNSEAVRLRVCELKDLVRQYDQTISEAEAASHDRRIETLSATVQECRLWFDEAPKEALTNDICNSIFSVGGLPNSTITGPSQSEVLLAELSKQNRKSELEVLVKSGMLLEDLMAQSSSDEVDDGYNCNE